MAGRTRTEAEQIELFNILQMEALGGERRNRITTEESRRDNSKTFYKPMAQLEGSRKDRDGRVLTDEQRNATKGWTTLHETLGDDEVVGEDFGVVNEGLGQTHRARLQAEQDVLYTKGGNPAVRAGRGAGVFRGRAQLSRNIPRFSSGNESNLAATPSRQARLGKHRIPKGEPTNEKPAGTLIENKPPTQSLRANYAALRIAASNVGPSRKLDVGRQRTSTLSLTDPNVFMAAAKGRSGPQQAHHSSQGPEETAAATTQQPVEQKKPTQIVEHKHAQVAEDKSSTSSGPPVKAVGKVPSQEQWNAIMSILKPDQVERVLKIFEQHGTPPAASGALISHITTGVAKKTPTTTEELSRDFADLSIRDKKAKKPTEESSKTSVQEPSRIGEPSVKADKVKEEKQSPSKSPKAPILAAPRDPAMKSAKPKQVKIVEPPERETGSPITRERLAKASSPQEAPKPDLFVATHVRPGFTKTFKAVEQPKPVDRSKAIDEADISNWSKVIEQPKAFEQPTALQSSELSAPSASLNPSPAPAPICTPAAIPARQGMAQRIQHARQSIIGEHISKSAFQKGPNFNKGYVRQQENRILEEDRKILHAELASLRKEDASTKPSNAPTTTLFSSSSTGHTIKSPAPQPTAPVAQTSPAKVPSAPPAKLTATTQEGTFSALPAHMQSRPRSTSNAPAPAPTPEPNLAPPQPSSALREKTNNALQSTPPPLPPLSAPTSAPKPRDTSATAQYATQNPFGGTSMHATPPSPLPFPSYPSSRGRDHGRARGRGFGLSSGFDSEVRRGRRPPGPEIPAFLRGMAADPNDPGAAARRQYGGD